MSKRFLGDSFNEQSLHLTTLINETQAAREATAAGEAAVGKTREEEREKADSRVKEESEKMEKQISRSAESWAKEREGLKERLKKEKEI